MEHNNQNPNINPEAVDENCQNNEVPCIIIEHVPDKTAQPEPDEATGKTAVETASRKGVSRSTVWVCIAIVVAGIIVAGAIWGRWYYHYYVDYGVPVSRTPAENVAILVPSDSTLMAEAAAQKKHKKAKKVKPEVVVSHDSILGVAMDFYELRGLRGEVRMEEPDTLDTNVMFYSRCADYEVDDRTIGSLVSQGNLVREDDSRLGYCGMVGERTVIGVSRSEDVRRCCEEAGGSFFRQFVLVSAGELPPSFRLRGKVERRALARTTDDRLFYVQTVYPEVMTAFADALREYGFVDAIYITGGKDYCYYRSRNGKRNDLGDITHYPHKKKGIVPWMVFTK